MLLRLMSVCHVHRA